MRFMNLFNEILQRCSDSRTIIDFLIVNLNILKSDCNLWAMLSIFCLNHLIQYIFRSISKTFFGVFPLNLFFENISPHVSAFEVFAVECYHLTINWWPSYLGTQRSTGNSHKPIGSWEWKGRRGLARCYLCEIQGWKEQRGQESSTTSLIPQLLNLIVDKHQLTGTWGILWKSLAVFAFPSVDIGFCTPEQPEIDTHVTNSYYIVN